MTNLCYNYQRMDRGRGAVLAVWLEIKFEYWSKFWGGWAAAGR